MPHFTVVPDVKPGKKYAYALRKTGKNSHLGGSEAESLSSTRKALGPILSPAENKNCTCIYIIYF
jgi:hypothetical protein